MSRDFELTQDIKDSCLWTLSVNCSRKLVAYKLMKQTAERISKASLIFDSTSIGLSYWVFFSSPPTVSKHIKSNIFMGILKSAWRGMEYKEMQGDINQLGGAFIFGPGKKVVSYAFM
jgi:hypothetical protein